MTGITETITRERAPEPGRAYTDAAGREYLRSHDGAWIDSNGHRWTDPSAVRPLRRLEPARPRAAYDEWHAVIVDALRFAAEHGHGNLAGDAKRAREALEGSGDE